MIEFITTPTEEWLNKAVSTCSTRLLVSSPYIGGWLPKITSQLSSKVSSHILTRTDLRDFASGASDLESVCALAESGATVVSSHRLHAKVYVIDERCGLVTSANATYSGMRRNLECGVIIQDKASVKQAASLILKGFGSTEMPQRWSSSELRSLQEPVRVLKKALAPMFVALKTGDRPLPDVSPKGEIADALMSHLPGWTKLVLEGVQMQNETFDIHSFVKACAPLAAKRYPNNRHVREKLRQGLQRIRDMGIIEFLGGGVYRWKVGKTK